jgi:hypothetical protein
MGLCFGLLSCGGQWQTGYLLANPAPLFAKMGWSMPGYIEPCLFECFVAKTGNAKFSKAKISIVIGSLLLS